MKRKSSPIGLGLWLAAIVTVGCAGSSELTNTSIPPVSERPYEDPDPLVEKFKHLYQETKTSYDRRDVGVRAIDEGVVKKGVLLSKLKHMFGSSVRTSAGPADEIGMVYFGDDLAPQQGNKNVAVAVGFNGWALNINVDRDGQVQNYYLDNIWKTHSYYEPHNKGQTPIAILRERYEAATSEIERRNICVQAIDEGAFESYGPVSAVDAIFGTHLADDRPSKKEDKRLSFVEFAVSSTSSPPIGWFLAVEHDYQGNIRNYYISNLRTLDKSLLRTSDKSL